MTRTRIVVFVVMVMAWLIALPSTALAQSSIGGTVKDSSGGVLPGVTVEVSSPALIEGSKTATTDGSGVYRVVDLRPGMYTVKFSLEGFSTVERSAFQLLSDFNARIDAEMKVGALQETVTVTGAAPIVDVQSAVKVAVLDREAMDNIPTGRSIFGLGQLVLGVTLSAPDVGGSASAMSQYMSMRAGSVSSANNNVMVDGMVINGLQSDGAVQTYINDADFQETTYQTAGVGADRSGGGVTLNMVPKEGGNRVSGDARAVIRPGQTQGDNYSQRFKDWGLPVDKFGNPAINRIDHVHDFAGSGGGPIQKDKLWFFTSGRALAPVNAVPNTFLDDGSQGLDDNYIRQGLVRLTYQVSPKHKFGAYYERVFKWRGHDMGPYDDPETVAIVWTSPNYSTMSAKYTGTMSSKLLVEGGFSQNTEYYRNLLQPGVDKERNTQDWYATASHSGTGGGLGVAAAQSSKSFPVSQVIQGSVSYVTGQHHAKAGLAYKFGKYGHGGDANADLQQGYNNFKRVEAQNYNIYFPTMTLPAAQFDEYFPTSAAFPFSSANRPCHPVTGSSVCSATVRNTPRLSQESLNQDLGIYLQDSFTMKRLTLNAGIRYETLNSQVDTYEIGAGRFVPARVADEGKNIPDWKDWAPRFQLVYDVFGNSKTAIKYSFNRYNEAATVGTAQGYNGIQAATSSRTWTDLNNDDIAQGQRTWNADGTYTDCVYLTAGCEINLSGITGGQAALSPTFGLPGDVAPYSGYPRRYRLEQGIEIQHALLPRLSLSGTYYKGWNKNRTKTINTSRTDDGTQGSQYQQVNLFNPIDGTPLLYYNRIVGSFPGANDITYVEDAIKSEYDTYSAEFQMRPFAGAQLSGGISFERTLTKNCDTTYPGAVADPTTLRFCDEWNLVPYAGGKAYGKPYAKNFKLSGAFPMMYGINLGVSYQNLTGGDIQPTYLYGSSFKYPDGSSGYTMLGASTIVPACPAQNGCVPGGTTSANLVSGAAGTSVALYPAGIIQNERIVQLDIKASKNFRVNRFSIQPALEMFNLMNIDQVRGRTSVQVANASGTYLQPSTMLQGRVLGFGVDVKF